MGKETYQLKIKSEYVRLLMIKDELTFFTDMLMNSLVSKEDAPSDKHEMLEVFLQRKRSMKWLSLTLKNFSDFIKNNHYDGGQTHVENTRDLRKKLTFFNHFRNKASAHMDPKLFERAVQWRPEIFGDEIKEEPDLQLMFSYLAVIEAAINSHLTDEKAPALFGHEIDLMYPPDNDKFISYLIDVVNLSLAWLDTSLNIIKKGMVFSNHEKVNELAFVASNTSFDLGKDSPVYFCENEMNLRLSRTFNKMEEMSAELGITKSDLEKYKQIIYGEFSGNNCK